MIFGPFFPTCLNLKMIYIFKSINQNLRNLFLNFVVYSQKVTSMSKFLQFILLILIFILTYEW